MARDCWRRLLALTRRMNKSNRGHILQSQNEGRQLPARAVVARRARIPLRVKIKNDFGSRLFGLFHVPLNAGLDDVDDFRVDGIADINVLTLGRRGRGGLLTLSRCSKKKETRNKNQEKKTLPSRFSSFTILVYGFGGEAWVRP